MRSGCSPCLGWKASRSGPTLNNDHVVSYRYCIWPNVGHEFSLLQQDNPVSVLTLPLHRSYPRILLCCSQEARCFQSQIFTRCTTAHVSHLFTYNDLSALRASLRALYTVPEECNSSASRACIAWIAPLRRSASRSTPYATSPPVDSTHLFTEEAHATSIYWSGGHRIVSVLELVLTDLDRQ
jgi:hypothetical protein